MEDDVVVGKQIPGSIKAARILLERIVETLDGHTQSTRR